MFIYFLLIKLALKLQKLSMFRASKIVLNLSERI